MMMRYFFFCLALQINIHAFAQEISGEQLLEKAIAFHDPEGNWKSFKGEMLIEMESPNNGKRSTAIQLDLL